MENSIEILKYICENRKFPPYNENINEIILLCSISKEKYEELISNRLNEINELKNLIGMKNEWRLTPIYGYAGVFEISHYNKKSSIVVDMYKDDRVNDKNKDDILSPSIYINY